MSVEPAKSDPNASSALWPLGIAREAWAYGLDAFQRSILLLDVLRERGKRYEEHTAQAAPNVLKFDFDLVMDGRKLPRPVNYGLIRITPPAGGW